MKHSTHRHVLLGATLLALSTVFYLLHFLFFRDAHHIFLYLLGDIAFVFIEVLLVTLIIHRVLDERDKAARLEKLNMVIGVFFSEAGTRLLKEFLKLDPEADALRTHLLIHPDWEIRDFQRATGWLKNRHCTADASRANLEELKQILSGRREFLVRLLENPSLLEHESFTDLLRAVFHLDEELEARNNVSNLPTADLRHLGGDIQRAYAMLLVQWVNYLQHLKKHYPYLFSLAVRTNPFDCKASTTVTE